MNITQDTIVDMPTRRGYYYLLTLKGSFGGATATLTAQYEGEGGGFNPIRGGHFVNPPDVERVFTAPSRLCRLTVTGTTITTNIRATWVEVSEAELQSRDIPAPPSWAFLSDRVEYTGVRTPTTTPSPGTVYSALLIGTPIYRFVSTARNTRNYPLEDSFYGSFSGGVLSDLLTIRNI